MYRIATSLLFVTALASPSWADTPIDESRPVNADATIFVSNCAGVINVQTWDKNVMSLTGRLGAGVEKLAIDGDASKLRIDVRLPKHGRNVEDTVLQLRVPVGVTLDLESVSADVAVQGTRGPLKVNTVSGDLNLAVQSAKVNAQTVSGDLRLNAPSRDTLVKSVSGDVTVSGLQGELLGETISGNLMVDGKSMSRLRLKSVSGDFLVNASLTDTARADLETLSGEVSFDLPAATNAEIDLNTFSGELTSELGDPIKDDVRRALLKVGNGGAQIKVHSFSGDIQLRKK